MDWTKIVDPICKVLRHYSAVPCNFFDQENARPLPLRDFNVNLIPLRSRFDSSSFRKLGAFRSARCWPGILHGRLFILSENASAVHATGQLSEVVLSWTHCDRRGRM